MPQIATIDTGKLVEKANSLNDCLEISADNTTSPEVGDKMMEIGEAQMAAAAPREMPILTMTGNKVAINNTPKPVAEATAKDIKQARKYANTIST